MTTIHTRQIQLTKNRGVAVLDTAVGFT